MQYFINKKTIAILVLTLVMVVGFVGSKYVGDMRTKREVLRQEEEKKRNEEEIKKKEEARRNAIAEAGVKAIIHTKVLKVAKDSITVQEMYPYIDSSGKTYPVRTFTLVPSGETTYTKRIYVANSEGLVTTNFSDEKGLVEEIKPEMFVSAMILDDLKDAGRARVRTVVYFEQFPGIQYSSSNSGNQKIPTLPPPSKNE